MTLPRTDQLPICKIPAHPSPSQMSAEEEHDYIDKIKSLLAQENAVLVAHYYTDAKLQALAEATGGTVADSLEMARFGKEHPATTLIVAGVKFMGESAKILSPNKRVLMPTLEATCSLDVSCPIAQFSAFCDEHPDREVVVYANTSAAVKARADWVVTSSIALKVAEHLAAKGQKIIWAPDKYLGDYVQRQSGVDMLPWQGSCIVHEQFKAKALAELKQQTTDVAVLVHPESPADVIALADVVGSTTQLINAARDLPQKNMIVATDRGIFYKMQQAAQGKNLIEAPNAGEGATCRSCAHCPWMAMNSLENLYESLKTGTNEIKVDLAIAEQAMRPLQRMLDFAKQGH